MSESQKANAGSGTGSTPGPGRLVRLGFVDTEVAARRFRALGGLAAPALDVVVSAADPDLALLGLSGLADAMDDTRRGELASRMSDDTDFAVRLVQVLGASAGLGEHLARHPTHWRELADPAYAAGPDSATVRAELLRAVGADPDDDQPVATTEPAEGSKLLRVAYHRRLLPLVARDLGELASVDQVTEELSELAAAVLDGALALARARLPENAAPCRLAIIAMGKCGAGELNYVSDVDVVFVAEPGRAAAPAAPGDDEPVDEQAALRTATTLAATLMRICSEHTAEGTIWPVDAGLRPEGKAGPLVRTLASHLAYLDRWAKTWEFQALLKARPVAGDLDLGRAYVDGVSPLVWRAADRDGFVDDVRGMRRRVLEHIPPGQVERQIKLGPGGLRDVEFAVQLLQLVHGRSDPALRGAGTLGALEALTSGGYVGREDGAALAEAYRFLRALEHRLQLRRLRRTHLLPDDETELRALGRSLGFGGDSRAELITAWRRHTQVVRRLHEKLFYRPLLSAVAAIPSEEGRLGADAARQRLTALGYADPAAALRHLEALTSGVSRRAAIQRQLLPAMLGWFADAPDPDAGLLAFRQVSDELGSTHWYLRLLRDEGAAAQHMATILASSRYATDLLRRAPEAVRMLAGDEELQPRGRDVLEAEMRAASGRYAEPREAVAALRAVRRRELFRVAAGDLLGLIPVDQVAAALTDITAATLSAALSAVVRDLERGRDAPLPTDLAIVAMGRFGGHEMSYGSDADVMFVHAPHEGADDKDAADVAHSAFTTMRSLLGEAGGEPPLVVDPSLRPEGRQGPLVRTLASYAAYYARWSHVWEAQALLRADPICGEEDLCRRFAELIDPLRWPRQPLREDDVRQIRRLKARMDSERLPRGADPTRHTKLGRGGLADVEWTVQLQQLEHAARVPGMRTTETLPAMAAAVEAGLFERADAEALAAAWRLATRTRNAVMLVRAKPSDSLPGASRDLAAVAQILGYRDGSSAYVEDYLRVTRHARAVVDRVFWS